MSDSPFDSFAGRLGKARKKAQPPEAANASAPPETPEASVPPSDPVTSEPSPFDSFARRLGKATKKTPAEDSVGAQTADAPPEQRAPGPVGTGAHVVKQGECITSIAKDAGHFWETLWNDPANAELRAARVNHNVLLPGDRVHVPPLREKWESRPTEARHRFRRKGQPEILRIRILRDGEPRQNEPYVLTIEGKEFSGVTDASGHLSCPIEPNARRGVLLVGVEPEVDRYDLHLGAIDPIDELSGVQGRLNNLGFDCGAVDGKYGPRTDAALRKYQKNRGLDVTGQPDDATRRRLQEDYGC